MSTDRPAAQIMNRLVAARPVPFRLGTLDRFDVDREDPLSIEEIPRLFDSCPMSRLWRADHNPLEIVEGVVAHLRGAEISGSLEASGRCPVCGAFLGARERSDGVVRWIDGIEHLVLSHGAWTEEHEALADRLFGQEAELETEGQRSPRSRSRSRSRARGLRLSGSLQPSAFSLEPGAGLSSAAPTRFGSGSGSGSGIGHHGVQSARIVSKKEPRMQADVEVFGEVRQHPGTPWSYSPEAAVLAIEEAYPQAGKALARGIVETAGRLGANPYDLANLIHFESGKTFRSDIKNPSSGAVGLIQFTKSTAHKLGTTLDALAKLTPVQQLEYVERYLQRVSGGNGDDRQEGPLDTLQSVSMAVFYPWARYWPVGQSFLESGHGRVTSWNPGISTPGDYLRKLLATSKLSGAPPAAPPTPGPSGPPGSPRTGADAAPAFMQRAMESWESWWGPRGASSAPVGTVDQASFSHSTSYDLLLRDATGSTWGPGPVQAGRYDVGYVSPTTGVFSVLFAGRSLEPGASYAVDRVGDQLRWSRR